MSRKMSEDMPKRRSKRMSEDIPLVSCLVARVFLYVSRWFEWQGALLTFLFLNLDSQEMEFHVETCSEEFYLNMCVFL